MKLKTENRKVKLIKEKLFIGGILGLIAVVIGVGVSVMASFNTTSIDPEIQNLIQPFNPILDVQFLEDYVSTRIIPPERFTISAITDSETQVITEIDPFAAITITPPKISTQSSNPL